MRLIDIENIDYVRLEDSLHCLEHHKGDEVECVICAPTVETIPKDQYEARLKANMVAMLTDLHLKMEELGDDLDPTEDWDYGYKSGVEDMIQLLDERIDKLKGESDAQEQKKE